MAHLKPLSKYAGRMLKRSRERFSSPQRRNETRESLFSPDLGCVLDDPSPPEKSMRASGRAFSSPVLKTPAVKFDFSEETAEDDGGYSEPDVPWDFGVPLFESSLCTSTPLKTRPVETLDSTLEGPQLLLEKISSPLPSPVQKLPHRQRVLTEVRDNSGPSVLPVRQRRRTRVLEFQTEEQWNAALTAYLNSVDRHMACSTELTELHHLMSCVAQRASGGRWQHPSDLSCRNYAQRCGNDAPLKTLAEWASSTNKRFNP